MAALAKAAIVLSSFLDAPVTKISDGDTFRVYLADQPPLFGEELPVRIKGIDTPEMNGKTACEKRKAREAKAALAHLLEGEKVDLHFCTRDMYFRLLCTVRVNDIDAGDYMLANGHAVLYTGKSKQPFKCRG